MDRDKLIRALYFGYKVEPTQDDRILEAFLTYEGYDGFYGNTKEEIDAFQAGIVTVLDILQRKIVGVMEEVK